MKIEIGTIGLRATSIKLKGAVKRYSSFLDDVHFDNSGIFVQDLPSLSSLFTLQENLLDHEIFQKADDLLNLLDDLRRETLMGTTSTNDLKNIEALAQNLHQVTQDPKLQDILMQIETRAVVELAKRQMQA